MDYLFNEQQKMIQELARKIAREKIKPVAAKYDESEEFAWDIMKIIASSDLFGVYIPEEYGGSGLSLTEASVIMEEITRTGGNAGCCHGQMYNMNTILRNGSDAQKKKYLPKIASGELRLQSMGVTEPTAGTDTTLLPVGTALTTAGNESWATG